MICSEDLIVAFLSGELSEDEERSFDEHLLSCEDCWRSVQEDRTGRLATERLREPAPPGLQERVTLSIMLANRELSRPLGSRRALNRSRRLIGVRTHGRLSLAVSILILSGLGLAGWFLAGTGSPPEPPQVAAVVAMMTPGRSPSSALRAGEQLSIGGQRVIVRAYVMNGTEAIVAVSSSPFALPASSHRLSGSSHTAWMETRGAFSMYGVNRVDGKQSMFVVAAMPMAELPEVAAHLHLI